MDQTLFLLNGRARESRDSARRKRKAGIKSNHPNHIRTYCRRNQEPVHDVEKSKKQKDVRQEATPDDELSMPPQVQERVRTAIVSFVVPYFQILFWMRAGQLMTLQSGREKTRDRTKNEDTTPYQVASVA